MDDYAPWTTAYARSMATVIYQVIAAEQDVTFNERIPQSALIDKIVGGERVRVRLNTIPAFPDGFDMIMRILKMGSSQKPASLIDLGYDEEQESLIEACINVPSGGTLVAGTTGSGKTTSLASMVSLKVEQFTINGICQIKIITVEDPPEIRMLNVTQVPVQRSKNDESGENPFTKYMNATLRSDPDAILVGEVRDNTTAHLLQHAIQSGHQVFTTLHTSSAIEQVDRLRSMGIKSKVLGSTSFISGLIYQTLVPIVCKKCALDINQFEEENANLRHRVKMLGRLRRILTKKELKNVRFKNHIGCSGCVSGISGRTVVAEVIVPSKKMKQLFSMDEDTQALDLYLEGGGRLIIDHAIDKVIAGLCDPTDVEYKVGMIDSGMSMHSEARIKAVENELKQVYQNEDKIENNTCDSFDGHNEFMKLAGETDIESLKSKIFNEKEPDNIKSM
jgi:type II secretory ATPase GspE/PulE/Tfp pilus assembly ATPase PilB-like protein